eukprot:SAG31_NODE_36947_length_308_cov_22.545455_1_plen_31_part_01
MNRLLNLDESTVALSEGEAVVAAAHLGAMVA